MRQLFALLMVTVVVLTACNTVRGVGKDVERTGEWVQEKVPANP